MKSRKKVLLLVAAGGLLCLGAYVSASYVLSPAVADSGGGHAESTSYQLDCSIGGVVHAGGVEPGTASSTSYSVEVGSASLVKGDAPASGGGGGGGGGGCLPGGGAGPLALVLPLGALVLLRRCRGKARAPSCSTAGTTCGCA